VPTKAITNSEVPTARVRPIEAKVTSPGTIKNPPPTPKSPESRPTTRPTAESSTPQRVVSRSLPSGSRAQVGPRLASAVVAKVSLGASRIAGTLALCHIRWATVSIKTAKATSRAGSGIAPPTSDPTGAASMPAAAKSSPVRRSTCPSRARSKAPTIAVVATVTSETPTAERGSTPSQ